jgi:hypothetical protein
MAVGLTVVDPPQSILPCRCRDVIPVKAHSTFYSESDNGCPLPSALPTTEREGYAGSAAISGSSRSRVRRLRHAISHVSAAMTQCGVCEDLTEEKRVVREPGFRVMGFRV